MSEIPTVRYFQYFLVGIRYFSVFVMHKAISVEIPPLYDINNLLNWQKCRRFDFAKAAEIAPCKTRCSSIATVIDETSPISPHYR